MVTGASKGIGYGLSIAMTEAGADLAIAARSIEALEDLARGIESRGRQALVIPLDLRRIEQIEDALNKVVNHYGRLDILVNNAGLGYNHPVTEVTEADWNEMMAVNLYGLFFCSQAAGKIMLAQGNGRIINMSSQTSEV